MSNLLSANMARLNGNKAFWSGFLLLTVMGAVERIGVYADADSSHLDEAFWIGALLIGFVLSVFVSLFVGTEYSDGTIRNKVISGHILREIQTSRRSIGSATRASFWMRLSSPPPPGGNREKTSFGIFTLRKRSSLWSRITSGI